MLCGGDSTVGSNPTATASWALFELRGELASGEPTRSRSASLEDVPRVLALSSFSEVAAMSSNGGFSSEASTARSSR